MPYCECPSCGQMFHVRALDTEKWYSERNLKFGELCSELCFCCWKPLKIDNRVFEISRKQNAQDFDPNDIAIVVEVIEMNGTIFFKTEFGNGSTKTLTRDKLYYSLKHNNSEI